MLCELQCTSTDKQVPDTEIKEERTDSQRIDGSEKTSLRRSNFWWPPNIKKELTSPKGVDKGNNKYFSLQEI